MQAFAGGIVGGYGSVNECYNKGNIYSYSLGNNNYNFAGGIAGSSTAVNNSYNYGNVKTSSTGTASYDYAGGIVGGASYSSYTISNSYNIGNVTALGETSKVGPIYGNGMEVNNSYYLENIMIDGNTINNIGIEKEEAYMKSPHMMNDLNGTSEVDTWVYKENKYPELKRNAVGSATPLTELIVKNTKQQFNVMTMVTNPEGGTISGSGEMTYEVIKYHENSEKPIEITANDGYVISEIVINGEILPITDSMETYLIEEGYFTEVEEDKIVVVTFALKENKIVLNKVDSETNEPLANAKFKIKRITSSANDAIGELTDNGAIYTTINTENELTEQVLGELTNNGDYYFIEENGKYYPTNSKTYQTSHGGTDGIHSITANSYFKIDLTGLSGVYVARINVDVSSESGYDYGYATITQTTEAPYYNSTAGQLFSISGTYYAASYLSGVLEGGQVYYLHLGYRKDTSVNEGTDQMIVNDIKVFESITNSYNFVNENGKIVSTNQGMINTASNSYIPIDLRDYSGEYVLTLNAEVSSKKYNGYGYANITENTNRPTNYYGGFMYISGEESAKDYTKTLQGGKLYYLHLGYQKYEAEAEGEDKFTVNSISIESKGFEVEGTTNPNGQIIATIPFGEYVITEQEAPEGYVLDTTPLEISFSSEEGNQHEYTIENIKMTNITVHHYLKQPNGEHTDIKVANDDIYIGKYDDDYQALPKIDLNNLELEKDDDGEYIIPENAIGQFGVGDFEVDYYYEPEPITLTINHYINGTEDKIVNEEEILNDANVEIDGEGNYNVVVNGIYELSDNNEYKNLIERYNFVSVVNPDEGTLDIEDSFIYSDNQELDYYYRVRKLNISTGVVTHKETDKFGLVHDVKGGTISGEDVGTYEVVEYKEDSTKTIKAIPEVGYVVKTITVNGIPIDFTTDDDGSVTLNNFIDVTEDKVVEVEFQREQGIVTVHHYIDGTEIKVPSIDGSGVEDEIKQGDIGGIYATKANENANPMYKAVRTEGETSGEFSEEDRVVIYYYQFVNPEVETSISKEAQTGQTKEVDEEYIPEGSDEPETRTVIYPLIIKENGEITYNIDYRLTIEKYYGLAKVEIVDTLPADIDLEKSVLADGEYDENNHTITWIEELENINTYENGTYEDIISKEVILVYKEQNVAEDLVNNVSATLKLYYPEGHPELSEGEGSGLELLTKEDEASSTVKQEYKAKVIVTKIWNDNEDEKLHRPESIIAVIKANDEIIEEKALSEENNWNYESELLPKYDESGNKIIYSVEEKESEENDLSYYSDVEINLLETEEDTYTSYLFQITNGLTIKSNITKTGTERIENSDDEVEYVIDFESEVTNYEASGKVTITETLPYKIDEEKSDLDGGVYDEETQTIIWEEEVTYEKVEDPESDKDIYRVRIIKEIKLVYIDIDNTTDKMTNNVKANVEIYDIGLLDETQDSYDTIIDIPGKATVKYIDKNTNEEISEEVLFEGKAGDEYEAEEKEIENYVLVEVEGGREGELPEEGKEVKFYYAKKTRVVERHIDILTNELIEDEIVHDGYEGKDYETEPKDYDNYRVDQNEIPENAKGQMKEEEIVVNYYYKTPARVIIKYLEYETDKKLAEESVITGFVNDQYETQKKEIDGYSFVKSDGAYEGKMTKSDIIVIYYYKQEEQKQNTSSSTNSNSGTTISNYQSSSNKANSNTTKATNTTSNKNTNSNTNTNNTVAATKITAPKTGDVLPVAAISIIGIVLIANIIQIMISQKKKENDKSDSED